MKPALKLIFAPLFRREKQVREAGLFLHGTAQGRVIKLDPRSSDILDTLVHEMTHVRYPNWTEKQVQDHTARRLKKMGWKEKARYLQLLGTATIEGE